MMGLTESAGHLPPLGTEEALRPLSLRSAECHDGREIERGTEIRLSVFSVQIGIESPVVCVILYEPLVA